MDPMTSDILTVAVGNTRARWGLFRSGKMDGPGQVGPCSDPEAIVAGLSELAQRGDDPAAVIASVNNSVADQIENVMLEGGWAKSRLFRINRDMPIELAHTLEDPSTVGQDRFLNAIGGYAQAQQACVVIDAGTAVTVDFVDGNGTFHGGAIAPGARMMLDALHEHTAALPHVEFAKFDPAKGPFGVDTPHAMLVGVYASIRGMVRHLAEQYAVYYEAYPQIIATGGDAAALFDGDDLVEHIVPDLQLIGIERACSRALAQQSDEQG